MIRFPSQHITSRPPLIRRPAATAPPRPTVRQLWLAGVDLGRDVVEAVERGRQLIDEAPVIRDADADEDGTSLPWVIFLLAVGVPLLLCLTATLVLIAARLVQ